MIVGIDASNLNEGGGLTHLLEVFLSFNIDEHNISKVVIWGRKKTLKKIYNYSWLTKITPKELSSNLLIRLLWQKYQLSNSAKENNCDIIFSPGGIFFCSFRPFVSMSQNMLPFESSEAMRYGFTSRLFRLMLLRKIQTHTFNSANGVIFLTSYAKEKVSKLLRNIPLNLTVIPHGVNPRFHLLPREQLNISEYSITRPFKIVYVSIIDQYKHQWHVVEAVSKLRKEGCPVTLDLYGLSYLPAKKRLEKSIKKFDKNGDWVTYYGLAAYSELHNIYKSANLGVFASSCENMPIILLEKMASGLPIACSKSGPMSEILGDSGEYFDPEQPLEIYHAIKKLIDNIQLRTEKSQASFDNSKKYSWDLCAYKTFSFLEDVIINYKKNGAVKLIK